MSTKPKAKAKTEDVGRLATAEENAADVAAAAPAKDELQLKREELAAAGLAHASFNNGQAVKTEDEAEAEVEDEGEETPQE